MRVLSVVGARPQFVKASVLSREFVRRGIEETLVHTGQHYDERMSDIFFEELAMPTPKHHLGVGSALHGAQTGEMMKRLEPIVLEEQPDWIVVYGDTNSTLAGALVGVKLHVPIAHVEAGLRSFNRDMPEEINRLVADRVSDLLLAPTEHSAAQLRREGVDRPIAVVGDLMVDLAVSASRYLPDHPPILDRFMIRAGHYAVVTVHRAANTDDPEVFGRIIEGLRATEMPVIFPVHPRTMSLVTRFDVGAGDNIRVCEPLSYMEMLALQRYAQVVITDSGGIQKEAITLGVPCVTLREETEWVETLDQGWNVLVGSDPIRIAATARRVAPRQRIAPFGDGTSARRITEAMIAHQRAALSQLQPCAS